MKFQDPRMHGSKDVGGVKFVMERGMGSWQDGPTSQKQ